LDRRLVREEIYYAALVTERPYEKARTHEEAAQIIARGKGTHFDPVLVDLFISVSD
jgi:putative two-component system response regulator